MKIQTVHQIKESYPLLHKVVSRFPSLFMRDHKTVSVDYRVFRTAMQILIGLGSGFVAAQAIYSAPACFVPFFSLGVSASAALYISQAIIRRKVHYQGSWPTLYLQGCSILKKKWRLLEAVSVGGGVISAYAVTAKLMRSAPSWACRQNSIGSGFWVGYLACDCTVWVCRRLFKAKTKQKKKATTHP